MRCLKCALVALILLGTLAMEHAHAQSTGTCEDTDILCATVTMGERSSTAYGVVASADEGSNTGTLGDADFEYGEEQDDEGNTVAVTHTVLAILYSPSANFLVLKMCDRTACGLESPNPATALEGLTLYIDGNGFAIDDAGDGLADYGFLGWSEVTMTLTEDSDYTVRIPASDAADPSSTTCDADNDIWCTTMTVGENVSAIAGYAQAEGEEPALGSITANSFTYKDVTYRIATMTQAFNAVFYVWETTIWLSGLNLDTIEDVLHLTLHVGDESFAMDSAKAYDFLEAGVLVWDTSTYERTFEKDTDYVLRVTEVDAEPYFIVESLDDQTFTVGTAVDETLPRAVSGNGLLSYTVTPTLPDGLSLDATTRVLSGTPTTSQLPAAYTYQAADVDDQPDTVSLTFNMGIQPAAPASLSASAGDAESLVSWSKPSDTGITGWQVKVGSGAWTNITPSDGPSGSNTLHHEVTGLTNGTQVTIQVRAYVESGGTRLDGAESQATVTPRANSAPVITGGSTSPIALSLAENSTSVVTVNATDADGDAVTFSLSGTDAASFAITGQAYAGSVTPASGVTLDYESGTTSYAFTVDVTDGIATTSQDYTLTVTDVIEAPSAPGAPTVTSVSSSSLSVSWSAPDNTGPDINDYDVRYRIQGSSAAWSDAGHTGVSLSLTLSSLTQATTYEVQVRASNAEDTGGWSPSGSASTLGILLTPSQLTVAEDDSGSFSVTLATAPSAPVTLDVANADGNAPLSVSPASLTFTASNFSQPKSVTVEVLDDSVDNDGRSFAVNLSARGGDYEGLSNSISVAVTDDEADPTVTLALSESSIEEDGGTSTVTASIDVRSSAVTSISVSVSPAASGVNLSTNTTLSIAAGDTTSTGTVTLTSVDNDVDTSDRDFTISGSATNTEGATDPADLTLTVTDDDEAGLLLDPTSLTVGEGLSVTYTVALTSEPTATVTLTPTPGAGEEVGVSSALTFLVSNWSEPQTVTVSGPTDDDLINPARSATIAHDLTSTDSNYSGTASETVSVTITDDETAGVSVSTTSVSVEEGGEASYTVVLASAPAADVDVTPSVAAGDPISVSSTLTFTSENWSEAQTVTVSGPTDDSQVNDARSGTIFHTVTSTDPDYDEFSVESVTVTVTDNDTAGVQVSDGAVRVVEGGQVTYSMQLASEPSSNVTVTVSVSVAGQVTIVESPVFTPQNWSEAQPLTISALDDSDTNGSRSLTISHQLESGDGNYDGLGVPDVSLTVLDDEQAGLSVSPAEIQILEGQFGTFNLVLTGEPVEPVNVEPSVEGADYIDTSGALTFTSQNWDVPQRVVVSTVDDDEENDTREVTMRFIITSDDLAYSDVSDGQATIRVLDDDGVIHVPAIAVQPAKAYEGDAGTSLLEFTITLSIASTVDTVVDWTIVEGTATLSDGDFEEASGTLTIPAGETVATVSVTIKGDVDEEGSETLSIVLSNPRGPEGVYLGEETAVGTIIDEERPSPLSIALSVSPAELSESGGVQGITVTAVAEGGTFGEDENLALSVSGGTATSGSDFNDPGSVTLVMPAGAESGSVDINLEVIDDFVDEPDEILVFSGVSPSDVPVTATEVRILDDDEPPSGFTLTALPAEIAEAGGGALIEVTANVEGGAFADEQTLTLSVADGTAQAGADYTRPEDLALVVPAGTLSGSASLTIEVLDDPYDEPDEDLSVNGTSATGLPVTGAQLTILDDDSAPTGFTLTAAPAELMEGGGAQTIEVTASVQGGVFEQAQTLSLSIADGTAEAGKDYTRPESLELVVPAGALSGSASLVVEVLDDPYDESDEDLSVSGTSVAGLPVTGMQLTILDDDEAPTGFALTASPAEFMEGAGAQTIEVTASVEGGVFEDEQTLTLRLAGDTATAGRDFAPREAVQLVLAAGATGASLSLDIELLDDPYDEPDEVLLVTGETESGLAVSAASVSIIDDDQAPTGFTLSLAPMEVQEAGGTRSIEVTATVQGGRFEEDSVLTISVQEGTATAGADFAAPQATQLVVPAGAMRGTASLALEVLDDPYDEPDEMLRVEGESALGVDVTGAAFRIIDDDATPTGITLTVSPTEFTEGDGARSVSVTATLEGGLLATETTIDLSLAGGTARAGLDYSPTEPGSILLPLGAESASTEFEFTIRDDGQVEPEESLELSGTSDSGLPVDTVTLRLIDNDKAEISIVSGIEVVEGDDGRDVRLEVSLSTSSYQEVRVDWQTADGSATAGADYEAASGVLTFAPGETTRQIVVRVLGDEYAEDAEDFEVRLAQPVNAELGTASARVVITDDDLDTARGTALEAVLAGMARTIASDAVDAVSGRVNRRSSASRGNAGRAAFGVGPESYSHTPVDGSPNDPSSWGSGAFADSRGVAGMGVSAVGSGLTSSDDWFMHAPTRRTPSAHGGGDAASRLIGMIPRSFNLDLADCGDGAGAGQCAGLSLWAQATRSSFSGRDDGYSTDGDLWTGHFGMDWSSAEQHMGGLMLSHTQGDLEFELDDPNERRMVDSSVDVSLTSFMPYGSWRLDRGQIWGLIGIGSGDADLSDHLGEVETDLEMRMMAFGGKRELSRGDRVDWSLNADGYAVELKADGVLDELRPANAHAERLRVLFEARTELGASERGHNQIRFEFGGRWDGGSASSGLGADVAAAFTHRNAATGLNLEANGRYTLAHGAKNFEEQSFGLAVEYDPGVRGTGMSFKLSPTWNQGHDLGGSLPFNSPMHMAGWANLQPEFGGGWMNARSGVGGGWTNGRSTTDGGWMPNQYEAEIAYGLVGKNGQLMRFYGSVTRSEWGRESLRIGAKLPLIERLDLWMHAEMACEGMSLGPECGVQLRIR